MSLETFSLSGADPVVWVMLAVIVAAFAPWAWYALAVMGANIRGRPVPSFGQVIGRRSRSAPPELEQVAADIREILTLLRTQSGTETRTERREERREDRRAPEPEDDGLDRSRAWSDRRRSDRGRAARGTGYAGADPDTAYQPGTGNRATDRPAISEAVRTALRRLKLGESELPDVASLTRAYRAAARSTHPDGGGASDSFVAIKAAYDAVLAEIGAARQAR